MARELAVIFLALVLPAVLAFPASLASFGGAEFAVSLAVALAAVVLVLLAAAVVRALLLEDLMASH